MDCFKLKIYTIKPETILKITKKIKWYHYTKFNPKKGSKKWKRKKQVGKIKNKWQDDRLTLNHINKPQ